MHWAVLKTLWLWHALAIVTVGSGLPFLLEKLMPVNVRRGRHWALSMRFCKLLALLGCVMTIPLAIDTVQADSESKTAVLRASCTVSKAFDGALGYLHCDEGRYLVTNPLNVAEDTQGTVVYLPTTKALVKFTKAGERHQTRPE